MTFICFSYYDSTSISFEKELSCWKCWHVTTAKWPRLSPPGAFWARWGEGDGIWVYGPCFSLYTGHSLGEPWLQTTGLTVDTWIWALSTWPVAGEEADLYTVGAEINRRWLEHSGWFFPRREGRGRGCSGDGGHSVIHREDRVAGAWCRGPCVSRNVSGAKAISQRRYVKMVRSPAGVRGTGAGLHLDGKCTWSCSVVWQRSQRLRLLGPELFVFPEFPSGGY